MKDVTILAMVLLAVTGAGLASEELNSFPFTIQGSKFLLNGEEVFLNIIGYQPLEPGQDLWGEIRERRVRDDLRRWRAYQGGTEPVVIRVYPGPTPEEPSRMPQIFYDGIRELGFWIIRDIFFEQNFCSGQDPNYTEKGYLAIDSMIAEVSDANALDLIFAWEIGNEFPNNENTLCWDAVNIKHFIEDMRNHLKNEISKLERDDISNWITWASYPPYDPLFTGGTPIEPDNLDYVAYNTYSYHPERIRDHQPGPVTGTPYQGYLAALKECYQDKPLVISETGYSDSNETASQDKLYSWYPIYTYGGMNPEQVAEGLADRYWDARLLCDDNDPNMVIAGMAVFEWNDEWHKGGTPGDDDGLPEEHFGLGKFIDHPQQPGYQLRYKLQQETVRDLYTLNFDENTSIIKSATADSNSLPVGGVTPVHTELLDEVAHPVRLRWESSRGYIVGDSENVEFYAGDVSLGPAVITAVAIDANGNVDRVSTNIDIERTEPNRIEILTSGISTLADHKFSGKVYNVDLTKYKLVCYLLDYELKLVPKPGYEMTSIWIDKQGYWWSTAYRGPADHIYCWLVPKSCNPPVDQKEGWSPPCAIAEANTSNMDPNYYADDDNDLLPDYWEQKYFNSTAEYDRYDDPDDDMANNLEEFLTDMDPNNQNDDDKDGLWDNWERHYFGDITIFDANDDPDGDGLSNMKEIDLQLHPGRTAADSDEDELPDLWEIRWFSNLDPNTYENPDGDCLGNLEEYELGLDPNGDEGDLDCDYDVDLSDLCTLAQNWLQSCSEPDWCERADLNRSGETNLADMAVVVENWLLDI